MEAALAERISSNNIERTYANKTFRLEHILVGISSKERPGDPFSGAINFWCQKLCDKSLEVWDHDAGRSVTIHNPFYPTWRELRADVWIKIFKPRVLDIIEKIWADPSRELGGVRGVSKYCSVICTRSCIDFKRHQEVLYKRGELFPDARLDDPKEITCAEDGVNEDTGTFIDTVSDDEGLTQPFEFKDLKPILTAIEYTVLYESFSEQKKIRELATELGISKSEADRVKQSAKKKAAQWIEYLKTAPASVAKAHLCPVFTRASLRPNRISKEHLESWNPARRQIVPFHDPAGEYRATVKRTERTRAKKECINQDCRNGLAISLDNSVLPAHRRSEAVRFLPAQTSKNNTLCAGCKAAASVKQAQVIEIPLATKLVAIAPDSLDALLASPSFLAENGSKHCNMEIAYA